MKADYPVLGHPGDALALSTSIQHPDQFINAGDNYLDWYVAEDYSHEDGTLWGGDTGVKTVWDPCPAGWRIPRQADFAGVTAYSYEAYDESVVNGFSRAGALLPTDNGAVVNGEKGYVAWCWTRSPVEELNRSYSLQMTVGDYGFTGAEMGANTRYIGLSVRCVKE